MATYEYRCPRDGAFDVTLPIGTAAARVLCVVCGDEAVRIFSAPLLARTPRPLAAAIERAAGSADTPEVVSEIPARPRARRSPANPTHARLPRP
ncbi:zinc ribbon domain-containing protein [Planosporangium flavigriseum]|uniref:Putative regulatory protein FmdB zinc ribbon domain-containing protein n=1 Tax=Planosporangium flavigriseum TaxID=373681 RepID=A0A8J3LLY6_9ACTN|nr:zinc ribbon domain-containing protein [Planosporangium flavigriseum]GIG75593.1 hypothetical protein Pfl04_39970 [Planosporangium flavigriseum]